MSTRGDQRAGKLPAGHFFLLAWIFLLAGAAPAPRTQGEGTEQAAPAEQTAPGAEDVDALILGVLVEHGFEDDAKIDDRLTKLKAEFGEIAADDPRRAARQRVINREIAALERYRDIEQQWKAQKALAPSVANGNIEEVERRAAEARVADRPSLVQAKVDALRGISDLDQLRARIQDDVTDPLEKATADKARLAKELGAYQSELLGIQGEVTSAREELAQVETDIGQWEQQLVPDMAPAENILLRRRIDTAKLAETVLGARLAFLGVREPFLGKIVRLKQAQLDEATSIVELRRAIKEAADAYLQGILAAAQRDARESVEQKKRELERAEYEYERLFKEQELRSQEIEEETAILRSAAQEVTGRTIATSELLDAANRAKQAYEVQYSRPDEEVLLENDVLSDILELQAAVDWREFQKTAQGIEDEIEDARDALSKVESEQSALDAEFAARMEAARSSHAEIRRDLGAEGVEASWNAERARWKELQTKIGEQLALEQRVIRETLRFLGRLSREAEQLRRTRLETIALLQRSNLFLRGQSHISIRAIREGVADLARIPAYSLGLARKTADYFLEPGHLQSILACIGLLLIAGIAHVVLESAVARRLRSWTQADGEEQQDRAARSAIYIGRGFVRSISVFLLFLLPAKVLPNLPLGVSTLLIQLGVTFAILMLARRVTQELFKYDARRLLPLSAGDSTRLYYASAFLVHLSLAYWPAYFALEYLGYENRGALEFARMAYLVLVGLTLLTVLVRRSVFFCMLPDSRVGRVLRLVTTLLHPFVVLLVPGLLILYALNYEILAGLITSVSVGLVVVSLVGFLVYHGALFMAARAFKIGVQDADEDAADTRKSRETSYALTRFLLRFGTLAVGFWVLLLVNGAVLGDLRYFFSVPLPIQSDEDPASAITYWNVAVAVFYFVVTLQLARHLKASLQDLILPKTSLDTGLQYTITTLVGYVVLALGISLALSQLFELEKLGYVVAALSIGIGFGLQEIISNFISGLILLFERPLKVGDLIEVGGTEGIVRRIQIRSTTIQTRDNVFILVPNKDFITQNVVNLIHDDARQRIRVHIGVAYGTDTALVRKVLLEVAKDNGKILKRPPPEVWFQDFGDSALLFDLLCWVEDPVDRHRISSHLRFAIDAAFQRYEIAIPFPQRDLHLRSVDIPFPVRLDTPATGESAATGNGPMEASESGDRAVKVPE